MRRLLLCMMLFLGVNGLCYGQTTLSSGDVAIIASNSDGDDNIYMVLLTSIVSTTEIKLTDNGWLPETSAFETDEGELTWTATSDLPKGTIIEILDSADPTTNYGTITESDAGFSLTSSNGDQVHIFQGTIGAPTPIFTFDFGTSGFETTDAAVSAGNEDTGVPSGLTEGVNAIATPSHKDNWYYNCVSLTDGSKSSILNEIANSDNWTFNDATEVEPISCNYGDAAITGDAGWRLLSMPITGGTVETVSDDTPVQGVTGGDNTGSDANFIIYDSDATFEQPTNVSTAWGDGLGFGLYFYDNTTAGSSELPVTLDASGAEPSSDVTVTLNPAASGYTLVGNPFASNLDASGMTATSSNISNNIAFWNNGSSSYSTQDRTTPYIIAPWQGFWVQTSSAAATDLTIPTSAKTTSATTGTFFSKTVANRGDIEFSLSSENTYDEAIRLSFREGATTGYDRDDFGKLTPLLSAYATMAFVDGENLKSVESLPYNLEESITVALEQQLVGISGEFTLAWSGMESIPSQWEVTLHDYETGESVNLREAGEYTFTAEAAVQTKKNPLSILTGPSAIEMQSSGDSRFGITINPAVINSVETEESPELFALEQNYPNPFNPATVINYQLSENSDVKLGVYDAMGREITVLVSESKAAGSYKVQWNAAGVASGMYYYRLEANGQSITRKMTLIK